MGQAVSHLSLQWQLTACGGEEEEVQPPRVAGGTGGVGLKGPIQGAVAFIDLNNNAKLDIAAEPYAFSGADGVCTCYRFYGERNGGHGYGRYRGVRSRWDSFLVNAVDTSSGSALTGVTLQAPAGSSRCFTYVCRCSIVLSAGVSQRPMWRPPSA